MTEIIVSWAIVIALHIVVWLAKKYNDKHYTTIRSMSKLAMVIGVYWTIYFLVETFGFPIIDTSLILLFILVMMRLDQYLTENALKFGATEANFVMAFLFKRLGVRKTDIVTFPFIAGFAIIVALYSPYSAKIAVSVLYVFVIINNLLVYMKKKQMRKVILDIN